MPDIHPHADLLEQAYPYALDALSDQDRRAVEDMLDRADESTADLFRATVRELRDTLASMTAVDAVPAPARVEEALQRALDRADNTVSPLRRARRARGLRWLAAAAAAAVVIGLGAGIAVYRSQSHHADEPTAQQILTHGDVREQKAPVTGGGTITVDASRELGAAIVSFDAVSAPPAGHVYQLWLISGSGQVRSAGVVPNLPTVAAPILMRFDDAGQLAMSVEPTGGSTAPTTQPVVAVPLA
ncbi:hypothetical protein GPX89_09880 [Nocardia sp. ET3-3]|uniref:Regulator of SigK n=1 Tax=Nocardia terrae TaxID=2675851 RepID=A0A7K1UT72_9NOCA|nr:anti-sigma factor [Nocardia terrae]MVU77547.1 hypothetical protein [Nocardia terrae]